MEWIDCPKEPGLYYFKLKGSKIIRYQEVFKMDRQFGVEVLYVVNTDEPTPVKQLKRIWCRIPDAPPIPERYQDSRQKVSG